MSERGTAAPAAQAASTAGALPSGPSASAPGRGRRIANQAIGYLFLLIPLWFFFEWGRPSQTLRLPLLISLTLFVAWLSEPKKHWPVQATGSLAFLGVLWFGVLIAQNSYSAFWVAYAITVTIVTIVIPMMHFVQNHRQARFLVNAMLLIFLYLGGWAVTHGGFGPAGAWGGQDQNYVSAFMCVAIPFAYFSFFFARSLMQRLWLSGLIAIFISAVVVGFSRGGFLGLCAVGLICLLNSPRKLLGFTLVGLAAAGAAVFAGDAYWAEMNTISDTDSGTASLRIELWKIAVRQFLHYPLTGVGPGNFPWRAGEFQSAEQFAMFDRNLTGNAVTHSLYFELISEAGLAGVIAFGAVGLASFKDLRWVTRTAGARREALLARKKRRGWTRANEVELEALSCSYYYALATLGAIAGFMVCSLFLSTLYYSTFWILCAFSFALKHMTLKSLAQGRAAAAATRAEPAPRATPAAARPQPPPGPAPGGDADAPRPAAAPDESDPPRLSDLLRARSR